MLFPTSSMALPWVSCYIPLNSYHLYVPLNSYHLYVSLIIDALKQRGAEEWRLNILHIHLHKHFTKIITFQVMISKFKNCGMGHSWDGNHLYSSHWCNFIYLQCTSGGILRGSGNQKVGAIVNAIGYYVVGLPIGISLMFAAKLGVIGKLQPWEAGQNHSLAPD